MLLKVIICIIVNYDLLSLFLYKMQILCRFIEL